MKKVYKVFIQILYFLVGIIIIIGFYFFMERFISEPWPGIVSAALALLINYTLGHYLLHRLWGVGNGSFFRYFRK